MITETDPQICCQRGEKIGSTLSFLTSKKLKNVYKHWLRKFTYITEASEWVKSLSRVWLFCDPMDYSPLGFSIHGVFQARILEWVAISFSRGSSPPREAASKMEKKFTFIDKNRIQYKCPMIENNWISNNTVIFGVLSIYYVCINGIY